MEPQDQSARLEPTNPVCNEAVLEQIRQAVSDGYLAVGHGGLEVGGVLYGRFGPEGLRVEASRPLPCEHAFGPSLRLSAADEEGLSLLLASTDPTLPGLEPVGWYRSYTRREATVTASDVVVLNRFFPEPGRVLFILRPIGRYWVSGLFFLRGEQGELNLDPAGAELELRPKLDFGSQTHAAAAQVIPEPVRAADPVFRRPLQVALACAALISSGAVAATAWQRYHATVVKPVIDKPVKERFVPVAQPVQPSIALQQQENTKLKNQVAALTTRNRRLEKTLTILRNRSQAQRSRRNKKMAQRRRTRR